MTDLTRNTYELADITLYQTEGGRHWIVAGTDVIELPDTWHPERFQRDVGAIIGGDWTVGDAAAEHPVHGYYDWREECLHIADVVDTYDVDTGKCVAQYSDADVQISVYESDQAEIVVEYLHEGNTDHLLICHELAEVLAVDPYRTHYAVYDQHAGLLHGIVSQADTDNGEDAATQLTDAIGAPTGQYNYDVYETGPIFEQLFDRYENDIVPQTRATEVTITV